MDSTIAIERKAGRPTSEETGRLNEQILQAAFKVFARESFGGATIEQIAQESRTTRRSVLSRFPDKEALLLSVVDMRVWRFQRLISPSEAMIAAKPLEALKESCRLMLDHVVAEDNLDFYRLCLAHVSKFPAISTISMGWNDRWATDLERIVERCQRSGMFKGRDPAMVATALIGAFISNPVNRAALGDAQFKDPVRLARYFEGMWSFVQDMS